MGFYIDSASSEALRVYKYNGGDLSLVYRFVLTPMNDVLERFIPLTLAPNLLTILGLICTLTAHVITMYFSPSFDIQLPSIMYIFIALTFFAYQTIDNLDGRQARRTNSSSPLGLLMDHGSDALIVTIGALTLGAAFQFGSSVQLFIFWLCGTIPFVFATMEEYWTKRLVLGYINGPTEGMLLCMLFCMLEYWHPGIWSQKVAIQFPYLASTAIGDWQCNIFIVVAGFLGILPTIIDNCVTISKHVNLLCGPFQQLMPFLLMWILAAIWIKFSTVSIFSMHPRLFLWMLGLLTANMMTKIMLAHVADQHHRVLQLPWLVFTLVTCVTLSNRLLRFDKPLIEETTALYMLLIFAVMNHAHFVIIVIREMTAALKIRCFSISAPSIRAAFAHNLHRPKVA